MPIQPTAKTSTSLQTVLVGHTRYGKTKKGLHTYFSSPRASDIHKSKASSASEQIQQCTKTHHRRKSNRRLCVFCRGRNDGLLACLLATMANRATHLARPSLSGRRRQQTTLLETEHADELNLYVVVGGLRGSGRATMMAFSF